MEWHINSRQCVSKALQLSLQTFHDPKLARCSPWGGEKQEDKELKTTCVWRNDVAKCSLGLLCCEHLQDISSHVLKVDHKKKKKWAILMGKYFEIMYSDVCCTFYLILFIVVLLHLLHYWLFWSLRIDSFVIPNKELRLFWVLWYKIKINMWSMDLPTLISFCFLQG